MMFASVSKLNIHAGDPTFDRLIEEIKAAQEEGIPEFSLDVNGADEEIRMDLEVALMDLGYELFYNPNEETLEVTYE